MNIRQRISDFQTLVNSKAIKIREEVGEAWRLLKIAQSQSEPEIIYSFLSSTQGGTGHLNRHLAPILGTDGRTVKFASIFLHKKPMVTGILEQAGKEQVVGHTCELGDLQILFLYLAADKSVCQCRSIVFQAKKTPSSGQHVIANRHQRRLYDEFSGFEYCHSALKGEKRLLPQDFTDRERALLYLFVGDLPIRARLIPADANKGAFVDFGELMVRVLNDSTGLNVKPKPVTGNGWSRIVWDQIDNVAETAFVQHGCRNNGIRALVDRFNSFEDSSEFFHDAPGEPGGIPMLLVIVSDGQLGSLENLQTQDHIEKISGDEPSATSVDAGTIGVVEQTKTDAVQGDENKCQKKNLESTSIADLLNLECATEKQQANILLELKRRSEDQQITADDANKVLVFLNCICDCLDPEILKVVDELRQKLKLIKQEVKVQLDESDH
jgi:hypothetical protein